jgi:hypothetical protein
MSPGEWERRIGAVEARLVRVRPIKLLIVNDPEEGLDEYRLDPALQTIQIGTAQQPAEYVSAERPWENGS